ncbi:cysteine-rich protein 1-like isoform X2 [Hyperolius riggenbachi]|uniref:cysteine-rich protein 1-like isoform X2 n=1 Tax=Hyperolius riggenbachi TaxID=752182 RepID=UPI0035A31A41
MTSYCPICGKPVYFAERKRSLGKDYHPFCLKCFQCKRQLTAGQHAEYDNIPYCNSCYLLRFGPRARGPASRRSIDSRAVTSSSTITK